MDIDAHDVDHRAQSHRRRFTYRIDERVGARSRRRTSHELWESGELRSVAARVHRIKPLWK
jgi:hypothetical protein